MAALTPQQLQIVTILRDARDWLSSNAVREMSGAASTNCVKVQVLGIRRRLGRAIDLSSEAGRGGRGYRLLRLDGAV